jgi:hypothetical protein
MTLTSLAAFDPLKLSTLLRNLPSGAIVYGLAPTGPLVAMPRARRSKNEVPGAIVHDGDNTIAVWDGNQYRPILRLSERDGQPILLAHYEQPEHEIE